MLWSGSKSAWMHFPMMQFGSSRRRQRPEDSSSFDSNALRLPIEGRRPDEAPRRKEKLRQHHLPFLLDAAQVAEALCTTKKAVYAMVERGQLPGVVRIGRRVLLREDALLDWLRQKSTPPSRR